MANLYICNAFSLSMLPEWRLRGHIDIDNDGGGRTMDCETALIVTSESDPVELLRRLEAEGLNVVSAVGHEDTAAVFSTVLGRDVQFNRVSIELGDEDELLVGQYVGPRLTLGATVLPEGARIDWLHVAIDY